MFLFFFICFVFFGGGAQEFISWDYYSHHAKSQILVDFIKSIVYGEQK